MIDRQLLCNGIAPVAAGRNERCGFTEAQPSLAERTRGPLGIAARPTEVDDFKRERDSYGPATQDDALGASARDPSLVRRPCDRVDATQERLDVWRESHPAHSCGR